MSDWLKRIVGAWPDRSRDSADAVDLDRRGREAVAAGLAEDAEACFRAALKLNPSLAETHSHLSSALNLQGRFAEAETASREALRLAPHLPDAHANLGNAMLFSGRYGEAIPHYVRALEIAPDLPDANIHMGLMGQPAPHLSSAMRHFEMKLDRSPESYVALVRLGLGYQATGNFDAAREKFARATELRPELAGPWASLALLSGAQGCAEKALALFRKALAINDNPIWHSTYLFFLQYCDRHSAEEIYREHASWGRSGVASTGGDRRFDNEPTADRKLRIGYLSGDFNRHPVAHFVEPIMRCHDKTRFEICCYSNALQSDEVTLRLKALSDTWHDVAAMSDADLCRQIQDDAIDILVDLSGHSRGQRMGVLAGRAAPVQMTYLGYPGSTGLPTVDYRISDAVCDPPGMTEHLHAEKLLRLDGCFVTYQPLADAPPVCVGPLLTRGYVTFGSFNNINKVNRRTIGLWADVLHVVPGSQMVIKHFATCHRQAQERILDAFAACGIDAHRIHLLYAHPDLVGHLDMYREIDIALDCTPYNGTTTTCEALWMGVPVVTLAGDRHSARVGTSLLGSVGLDEWVATTAGDYVGIAAKLAADPERLRGLRLTLRQRMQDSPLMDGPRFTARLENTYASVWQRWCQANRR